MGFFYLESALFQRASNREFDRVRAAAARSQAKSQSIPVRLERDRITDRIIPASLVPGEGLGRIQIPALHLSAIVLEGVGAETLRRAVGHVPRSALLGQPGNTVLAGHRDTFFRSLRNIQPGDLITLQTAQASFDYRVQTTSIVDPDDVAVLDATASDTLTLVTCYPFYFIGPAPRRFIVRAERSSPR
ncbi:MAG TPA: class D sortase [Terriglobales bacterium]